MEILGREGGAESVYHTEEFVEGCSLFTPYSYLGDRATLYLAVADSVSHRMHLGRFRLTMRKTFHHHYSPCAEGGTLPHRSPGMGWVDLWRILGISYEKL